MKKKKGYLLPMAIIFVLISTIMGMGILYLGGTEQVTAIKRYHEEKAFYIAEAGINRAFAYKKANESWHPETSPISFGGGTFVVSETVQGDTIIFTSTGTYHNQIATVSIITYRSPGSSSGGSFGSGVFGSDSITLANNAWIDGYDSRLGPYGPSNHGPYGDTGSTGVITMYNNSHIYGTAMVEDPSKLIKTGGSTVTDSDLHHTFSSPFDNLPKVTIPSDLLNLPYPMQGDPRISGQYTLIGGSLTVGNNKVITISGGDFRFRNITLNNNSIMNITGDTRFYVEQTFLLSNNVKVNIQNNSTVIWYFGGLGTSFPLNLSNNSEINNTSSVPGNLRIYISVPSGTPYPYPSQLTISNNAKIFNGVIYAPDTQVLIVNNGQVYGGIVAKNISLLNNANVHYDIALRDANFPEDPGGGGLPPGPRTIVRWTKPDWSSRLQ